MKYIVENGPVTVDAITLMLKGTPQNTSKGMMPLKQHNLIIESTQGHWIPTELGNAVIAQLEPSE